MIIPDRSLREVGVGSVIFYSATGRKSYLRTRRGDQTNFKRSESFRSRLSKEKKVTKVKTLLKFDIYREGNVQNGHIGFSAGHSG